MTAALDLNFRIVRPRPAEDGAAHNVSADMEDIFRTAPKPAATSQPRVRALTPRTRGGRERSIAGVGVAAAAALIGLAVGLVAMRHSPPTGTTPAAPQMALEVAQPPPQSQPLKTEPAVVTAAHVRPVAPPSPRLRRVAGPTLGRCESLHHGAQARCAYPAVMMADRRLRVAYGRAVRAGVSRPVLVSYRNRWAGLRHDATDRPAHAVAAYSAMADDLQRLAQRARS